MNILVLDPANSTGYCIFKHNEDEASIDITSWGFIEVEQCDYIGDQYVNLLKQVEKLIKDNDIEKVAVEDYFFSNRSPQGANLNCSYRAMIHMKCRELGLHYEVLNISLWKKFINGRSTPTKDQKAKWGKEPSKKLMTQESLWKTWDIRFPNHSKSLKTGKPIKFRYDIVDAVAMAIFYASIYLHANKIQYSVIIDEDHEWKKIPKGTYDYGG
jgi:Holliday junction resolvasome RuvABC endonuclease subunit